LPCDIILLNGSCIVNESILTGESIPIIKNELPNNKNIYDVNGENKSHTLFAGTYCLETRYYQKDKYRVLGIVSEVGFSTIKGQLVRTILFPKECNFEFYRDCLKFIGFMFIFGMMGFSVSLYMMIEQKIDNVMIIKRSLDLITITVPPALPTCMSIGIIIAINTLKKYSIFCISP
jgi:cation-transporting ATPase 13A2